VELSDVPERLLTRVSETCLRLPEAELTSDRYGHTFKVRRRVFVYLVAVDDPGGRHIPMLVCTADPDERAALLASGHPFFPTRNGRDRLGIVLDTSVDWGEIEELILESYRLVAPRKLAALLDAG
jgi:predicted DNA-binding protein (MmcQ/YjbR family)